MAWNFFLEDNYNIRLITKIKWLDMKWAIRSRRINESREKSTNSTPLNSDIAIILNNYKVRYLNFRKIHAWHLLYK